MQEPILNYEDGWKEMQKIVNKVYSILQKMYEGQNSQKEQITKQDYSKAYTGEQLLIQLVKWWDIYQLLLKYMNRWFIYLEESYIKHNGKKNLQIVGIEIWYQNIHDKVRMNTIQAYKLLLSQDRQGIQTDKSLLKKVTQIFLKLNEIYKNSKQQTIYKELENQIISETKNFYIKKYADWVDSLNCEEYLQQVEELMNQEYQRLESCIEKRVDDKINNEQTFKEIKKCFSQELIGKYKQQLLSKETGFNYMLENQQTKNLNRVYNLYQTLNDKYEGIKENFKEFIAEKGKNLFEQQKQEIQKKKQELEQQSQKKNIEAKDLFLSQRLLQEKSENDENEKSMITLLKMSCGVESTKVLEGMIQDIQIAEEFKKNYQIYARQQTDLPYPSEIDTNIKVLQKANWPQYNEITLNVPQIFQNIIQHFTKFYSGIKKNQELCWIHIQNTVEMNAIYGTKKYLLNISMHQAVILMAFEEHDNWLTVAEIQNIVGLPFDLLNQNLLKLSMHKQKSYLLERDTSISQNKKLDIQKDRFRFNTKFQQIAKRIIINPIYEKEKIKKSCIDEDRGFAIEACIVRIMKSKRKLRYEEIYPEVCQLIKLFTPDLKLTKKKIESLINKDFLERDENDINVLLYKA
ncbi:Cullin repeat-like-containing domain [Pseudocohnilembus persalinus]|uniref:Cullin repeat-like-containing domain n=1 Tax=Pseudocohnilembus persalinus TaxID=266149 RepID=A0A0V0R182_PSEPJ|nr:Cullin repeat-like-containing domain [Pseudocohnilembus persalinus]|eukprot:KRX08276.1 Cullin repeat-like-containing domain [Pseudocohnilembus persalinus]